MSCNSVGVLFTHFPIAILTRVTGFFWHILLPFRLRRHNMISPLLLYRRSSEKSSCIPSLQPVCSKSLQHHYSRRGLLQFQENTCPFTSGTRLSCFGRKASSRFGFPSAAYMWQVPLCSFLPASFLSLSSANSERIPMRCRYLRRMM